MEMDQIQEEDKVDVNPSSFKQTVSVYPDAFIKQKMRLNKLHQLNTDKLEIYDKEWISKKDLIKWINERPFCNVRKCLLKRLNRK